MCCPAIQTRTQQAIHPLTVCSKLGDMSALPESHYDLVALIPPKGVIDRPPKAIQTPNSHPSAFVRHMVRGTLRCNASESGPDAQELAQ
jgi:hypothetical protein